jgi:dUTP pyrophosphatase
VITVPASYDPGYRPEKATPGSAGFDLKASIPEPVTISAWSRAVVPTGVKLGLPDGVEAQVRPRSGMAFKHGVTILNAPGTIDSDYRGEVKVALVNLSGEDYVVNPGDRVAQLVISRVAEVEIVSGNLRESERGEGGFGSTGR